jgi:hypothetical protein
VKYSFITFIGFALAIISFGWFIGTSNYNEVYAVFTAVELKYVCFMFLAYVLVYVFRTIRWKLLLKPIGDISFWKAFEITLIGFGANIILPARAGEFIKPLLASRELKTTFSASFTTVVLERIFDLIVLMSLLALIMFYLPSILGNDAQVPDFFFSISRLFIFLPFFAIIVCTLAAHYPHKFLSAMKVLCSYLPHWFGDRIFSIATSFTNGIEALRSPLRFLSILLVSFCLWAINLFYYWVCGLACGFDMGATGSAIAMTATAFAAALPQAPGYIGVFHVAMEMALKSVGIGTSQAKVCAILNWAMAAIPVAIASVILVFAEGLTLRGLAHSRPDDNGVPVVDEASELDEQSVVLRDNLSV